MKMGESKVGHYIYKSDIGKVRNTNEDFCCATKNKSGDVLLAVADGMGGYVKGDVAAKLAINTLKKAFKAIDCFTNSLEVRRFLNRIIKNINTAILKVSNENELIKKMGTTLTAVIIRKNRLFVASIGDSRAYFLDGESLVRLTEDDSYVNYLYHMQKIRFEDMETHPKRHILTSALGVNLNPNFTIDSYRYTGDLIFLCSDGLYTMLSEEEMSDILKAQNTLEEKCDFLINSANENGGKDNIALVIWEVEA